MDTVQISSNAISSLDVVNNSSSADANNAAEPVSTAAIGQIQNLSELKRVILGIRDKYLYNVASPQSFENLQMLVF